MNSAALTKARPAADEVRTEYHLAAGVGGCAFFVASVRVGGRIVDTHETDAFSDERTEAAARADAETWCKRQRALRTEVLP